MRMHLFLQAPLIGRRRTPFLVILGNRHLELWLLHSYSSLWLSLFLLLMNGQKISSFSCCLLIPSQAPDMRGWPPDASPKYPKFRVCHLFATEVPGHIITWLKIDNSDDDNLSVLWKLEIPAILPDIWGSGGKALIPHSWGFQAGGVCSHGTVWALLGKVVTYLSQDLGHEQGT